MLLIFISSVCSLLVSSLKIGIEQAALGDVVGSLACDLVEFIGKFSTMVAHCWGLKACGSLEWIDEDDAVLTRHF